MNRSYYGQFTSIIYLVFDILLTIETCAIIFFNSDTFGVVPEGSTHAESILFAMALWILSEIIALKYGDFGFFGAAREEQKKQKFYDSQEYRDMFGKGK